MSTQLPETVRQEIEDLPRHYQIRHRIVRDRVTMTARIRGVPVVIALDAGSYPFTPPELELAAGWTWEAASSGRIQCLESQLRWNRTLGLAVLLRELKQRFRDRPPVRSRRRRRWRILRVVFGWLRRLREWILRRRRERWRRLRSGFGWLRRKEEVPTEAAVEGTDSEPLREIYDRMIREHTERVHRYQRAVAELVSQWRRKAERLDAQRAEVQDLEAREAKALEQAEGIVARLEGEGKSAAEIRADAEYLRIRTVYEECSAELSEAAERAEKLEADADKHLAKMERHEAQLEKLMGELEDLKDEAAEVVTDMTLVQLEKEIVDIRAGISRDGLAEELREIRRRLRKQRAAIRVTRETAVEDDGDEFYLEVAEKASAARELEKTLGLEQPPPRLREPES